MVIKDNNDTNLPQTTVEHWIQYKIKILSSHSILLPLLKSTSFWETFETETLCQPPKTKNLAYLLNYLQLEVLTLCKFTPTIVAQSAGAVEYTDCTSAEG